MPGIGVAHADHDRRGHRLSAGPGQIVGRHPASPDVLRSDPIAFPELEHRQGRPDLFARVKLEVGQFLAAADVQAGRRRRE